MTVKWQLEKNNTHYRVVQAGNAMRLYRNNVLHSQWNPNNPVSGKLWDLFVISILALGKKVERVLVLGAGGGSVVNLVHYYYPDAEVIALDLDAVHLRIAKQYFNVNTARCDLINAEAEGWLYAYKGKKFDLIIDDVFNEHNSIPFRAIDKKSSWITALLKRLKRQGVLVFNFADQKEWNSNYTLWSQALLQYNIGVAAHALCDNKIIHVSKEALSRKEVIAGLNRFQHREFMKHINNNLFSYRLAKKYRAK